MSNNFERVYINLTLETLRKVDEAAKRDKRSRSNYIDIVLEQAHASCADTAPRKTEKEPHDAMMERET